MEGQASALVDTLLTTRAVPNAGGSIRIRRFLDIDEDQVREGLSLDLTGELALSSSHQAAVDREGGIVRVRIYAAGELAQSIAGELATADCPPSSGKGWNARLTHRNSEHLHPFDKPAVVELRADSKRIGEAFELRGGEAVRGELRIYEPGQDLNDKHGRLWLRSWSSGAFKADTLIVELPNEWECLSENSDDLNPNEVWLERAGRTFWKVTGRFVAQSPVGDRYLVRPGQDVAQRDMLHLYGTRCDKAWHVEGLPLIVGSPTVQLARSSKHHPIGSERVGWRRLGERDWKPLNSPPPLGQLEFGWCDAETGHLRAKTSAVLLPEGFSIDMEKNGDSLSIEVAGWPGCSELSLGRSTGVGKWRLNLSRIGQDRVDLTLGSVAGGDILLQVPLPIISRIAEWDGTLLPCDSIISLGTLNRYFARNDRYSLMATIGMVRSN